MDKREKAIAEVEAELNSKIANDGIIDLVKHNLSSEHITTEAWCKPLLLLMEYNITDNSKLAFINLNKDLHLEHILPIKFHKFPEWNHITKDGAAAWLNSAGNITLLGGAKNIEASNNPFSVKQEVYRGKGKYDDKNDKITAFLITQKIVQDYGSKKYNCEWNKEAMIDRWKWFFEEAEELLDIDLKKEIEKHTPVIV